MLEKTWYVSQWVLEEPEPPHPTREKKQIDQNIEALKNILSSEKEDKQKRKEIKKILNFQLEINEVKSYITYHSEYPHFAEIVV